MTARCARHGSSAAKLACAANLHYTVLTVLQPVMSDDIWRDAKPHTGDSAGESTADEPSLLDAPEASAEHGDSAVDSLKPDASDPWASFEPLYNEHHERLYRVAVLLCAGNTADAEDTVAETFIRVHRAWLNGRVDDFFPYARRSLVNDVMARYRKQQTAKKYMPLTSENEAHRDRPVDDSVVDSKIVLDALDQLSPRRRTAVVLRYFEDLPYHEIAAVMEVAIGTAKAQVSGGLTQLRGIMAAAPGAQT